MENANDELTEQVKLVPFLDRPLPEVELEMNTLVKEGWELRGAGEGAGAFFVFSRFGDGPRRRRCRPRNSPEEAIASNELQELRRAVRDQHLTLLERDRQLDPESLRHWDKMRSERDQARTNVADLLGIVHSLAEQLIWCSGADDFQVGAKASEGWEKGPRKALDEYRRFMIRFDAL